jgi:hypothetical protein
VPKLIEREGPTGLIVTTTWASLHPENETRMLSITVKDDQDQTARVLGALANRSNGCGPAEIDLTPWHAYQSWLELAGAREVTIPFAHALAAGCSTKAVRLRRDFGAVLALIATHAMLHQAQRRTDANGRIVALLHDYAAVYSLVDDIISEGVSATVSPATRETVEAVKVLAADSDFPITVAKVAKKLDLDRSVVSRRVKVAVSHGYLTNEETKTRQPARLALGDPLPEEAGVLLHPDSLVEGEGGYSILSDTRAHVHAQDTQETWLDLAVSS